MREVLDELLETWKAGETAGLGTVVQTFRSATHTSLAAMTAGANLRNWRTEPRDSSA